MYIFNFDSLQSFIQTIVKQVGNLINNSKEYNYVTPSIMYSELLISIEKSQ